MKGFRSHWEIKREGWEGSVSSPDSGFHALLLQRISASWTSQLPE